MEQKENKTGKIFILIAAIIIFIVAIVYIYTLYTKEGESRSVFIETPSGKADHIVVNANLVSIDPIKGEMAVRLNFEPKGALADEKGFLKEEVDLYINSATGKQDYNFTKNKIINPIDVVLSLYDGLVTDYPLDKHKSELIIETTAKIIKNEGSQETDISGIDNVLNFSGSVTGYKISAEQDTESNDYYTILNIQIERAYSVKFFSFFVICTMWLLIILLMSLLFNIIIRKRKIEINMFTFTSAMIFAFPAFRNMMPFAPPIGAFPDYIAFFWAEAAAALTLSGLIITWVLRKPVHN
jgi:hypothetical protein